MLKLNFEFESDGSHTKITTESPALRNLAHLASVGREQYNRDLAQIAHLLVCAACGLAGQAGYPIDELLAMKPPGKS